MVGCTVYLALHFPNSNKPSKTQNVSETALSRLSCKKYLNRGYWSANLKGQNTNNEQKYRTLLHTKTSNERIII